MVYRISLILLAAAFLLIAGRNAAGAPAQPGHGNTCIQCHANRSTGFTAGHAFAANDCTICHAGNDEDVTQDGSHAEMTGFPGDLGNAAKACGGCHARNVESVGRSLMHSGQGIVDVTRRLVDGHSGDAGTVNFQSLGHGVADSMLRKLCASCHLGQPKTEHQHDVMRDRGGGCLACHINDYPEDVHPALTTKISDARCFGCHARSGRISLSYAGLAESETGTLRLSDGRHVERRPADIHYQAGMGCVDCHTGVGLMGGIEGALHQGDAVDISCTDCHIRNDQAVSTKNGTALEHVEVRPDGSWLHTKTTGRVLNIPYLDPANHAGDDHERLECSTCHSQWAPQCFGCHMEYDSDGSQWDHVDRQVTPGRWREERSNIRNDLGSLGVSENGQIALFVPGMVMTVDHPDWTDQKFVRVFAPLSPHTTGASRSCKSCHRSSVALGLGQGELVERNGDVHFEPAHDLLQDGLPLDAWTDIERSLGGATPLENQRPLNVGEMKTVLGVQLPGDD